MTPSRVLRLNKVKCGERGNRTPRASLQLSRFQNDFLSQFGSSPLCQGDGNRTRDFRFEDRGLAINLHPECEQVM